MRTTLNSSGIRIMKSLFKKKLLTAAMVTGAVLPLFAYGQTQHAGHAEHMPAASKSSVPAEAAGMNHETMNMSDMDHSSMDMTGMDHGSMSGMDHGSGEMDHGDMQMQGGSAPP